MVGFSLRGKVKVLVTQLCWTFCDRMDCKPPGSSVYGIFQARKLGWVAVPFSSGSSQPRDGIQVSGIAGRLYHWCHQGNPFKTEVLT